METSDHRNHVISVQALAALGAPEMAYVREIAGEDLIEEMRRDSYTGPVLNIPPHQKFYALYAADGTRLAVADSREAVIGAALQYHMTPVSVH